MSSLLRLTGYGLYCAEGDFYVDPWRKVERAVVTHGHTDHVCRGCGRYLTAAPGKSVLRARLGSGAVIEAAAYCEPILINGVQVSLHPAGHILGSAQVRVEHRSEVWVVSGDYKIEPDRTATPFEPVRCHTFITESTFGLPIYRWPPQSEVFSEINAWWRANQQAGHASLLNAYTLGKSQRLLAGVDPDIGPIFCDPAVDVFNMAYRSAGVDLPPIRPLDTATASDWRRALIVAPYFINGGPLAAQFGPVSNGHASGWMRLRAARRQGGLDRGFVLSDHADWPGLLQAVAATGAERVWVTHGFSDVLARYLRDFGLDARPIPTRYRPEAAPVESTTPAEDEIGPPLAQEGP